MIVRTACLLILLFSPAVVRAEIDFEKQIAPIFQQHCVKCHGPEKQKGGLRFDTSSGAMVEGDSGARAIVSSNVEESEIIRRVTSDDDAERMPPEGAAVPAEQIALLREWIASGAKWPDGGAPAGKGEMVVTDEDRQHWSFRPLHASAVPVVQSTQNAHGEIDRFIVAALESRRLTLTAMAPPRKLVRRIYFDLIGLPPTIQEVADFEAAAAADLHSAIAALVDRLLASHHYGERWARHWLDVARYADSNGQEGDQDRPYAYQYRDFVIKALNDDLPYDEFVRWQIAGDELAPDNPLAVAATGFLTAGPHTVLDVPMQEEKIRNRYNELDDMLSTLGSGMLGLSIGCARCHDHKFDAIPTRDYYRLLAAVHSGDRHEALLGTRAEVQAYEAAHADWQKEFSQAEDALKKLLGEQRKLRETQLRAEKIAALAISDNEKALLRGMPDTDDARKLAKQHEKALNVSDEDLQRSMDGEQRKQWDALNSTVTELKNAEPKSPPRALAFHDVAAEPKPTWLFHRADFYDKSEPVELGFLSVLTTGKSPEDYWTEARSQRVVPDSTYQRAALARWISDTEQGGGALLARVIVNRVWRHHFGEGLVRTASDFGVQGEKPSHPELLEWLAYDFVAHGWRIKRLHRQMMLSAAYLQDTTFDEAKSQVDPDNRLLWRRRPMRLEAEILRDAMLAAGDRMNLEPFGPAFKPPIAPEAMVARNLKTPYNPDAADSGKLRRRSVYMFHKRVVPYPLLQAFDKPDALQSCGRRDMTTVAPQALALLNDQFVRDRAADFAGRLQKEVGDDMEGAARRAFAIALARAPSDTELQASRDFILQRRSDRQSRDGNVAASEADRAALTDYCQVLFGLNEFLYVD